MLHAVNALKPEVARVREKHRRVAEKLHRRVAEKLHRRRLAVSGLPITREFRRSMRGQESREDISRNISPVAEGFASDGYPRQ